MLSSVIKKNAFIFFLRASQGATVGIGFAVFTTYWIIFQCANAATYMCKGTLSISIIEANLDITSISIS